MDVQKTKNVYERRFLEFGPSPKGVYWQTIKTQYARFETLIKAIDKIDTNGGIKIADFGCGYGDFNKYLKKDFINFKYIGTDISELILKEAKKKNRQNSIFYKYYIINYSFEKKLF